VKYYPHYHCLASGALMVCCVNVHLSLLRSHHHHFHPMLLVLLLVYHIIGGAVSSLHCMCMVRYYPHPLLCAYNKYNIKIKIFFSIFLFLNFLIHYFPFSIFFICFMFLILILFFFFKKVFLLFNNNFVVFFFGRNFQRKTT
jgi:hypothetical protein